MTISKKLYISISVIVILLIGLEIFFEISISNVRKELNSIQEATELEALLNARVVDHYKWVEALSVGTMMFGQEFTKALDPTKCALGKWYYSFTPPEKLRVPYEKLEEPHRRLHSTAEKIISALNKNDYEAAKFILNTETKPALEEVQSHLKEMQVGYQKIREENFVNTLESLLRLINLSRIVFIIIALLMFFGFSIFVVNPIVKSLRKVTTIANNIAVGKLDAID